MPRPGARLSICDPACPWAYAWGNCLSVSQCRRVTCVSLLPQAQPGVFRHHLDGARGASYTPDMLYNPKQLSFVSPVATYQTDLLHA